MKVIDFINEVAPKHNRTSCSDENSNGNEYFNEFGYPRCTRCALLFYEERGHWPHDAEIATSEIRFKAAPF